MQSALLQAFQFLSDIGGVLGLWLGFSLITIFEFIELGVDVIVLSFCKCCRRKCRRSDKKTTSTECLKDVDSESADCATPARYWSPRKSNKISPICISDSKLDQGDSTKEPATSYLDETPHEMLSRLPPPEAHEGRSVTRRSAERRRVQAQIEALRRSTSALSTSARPTSALSTRMVVVDDKSPDDEAVPDDNQLYDMRPTSEVYGFFYV